MKISMNIIDIFSLVVFIYPEKLYKKECTVMLADNESHVSILAEYLNLLLANKSIYLHTYTKQILCESEK